ncbi:MAG: hypothetical protein ACRCZF_03375, partial [Gemmataceae bacterium]
MRVLTVAVSLLVFGFATPPILAQEPPPPRASEVLAGPDPAPEIEPVARPTRGWYGEMELAIVRVKIDTDSEYLSNGVTTATTVSPTVSFGYQFGSGRTVHFDYQYLTGSG